MKKSVVSILFLICCTTTFALPLGNPSEASLFTNGTWLKGDSCFNWCNVLSLRVGFYGDYVFNRHIEANNVVVDDADVEQFQIFTNAGYLALNICNRVDVFTTLGASNFNFEGNGSVFTPDPAANEYFELVMTTDFSWSVGVRGTLWECGCFSVGFEGQYFRSDPDPDFFLIYDTGSLLYFSNDSKTEYQEWQAGLGIAYRFATSCPSLALVPYTGVTWSESRLKGMFEEEIFVTNHFESKKPWGYVVGASLTLCDMIGVTVEGRWASEKALYVNGQFRF